MEDHARHLLGDLGQQGFSLFAQRFGDERIFQVPLAEARFQKLFNLPGKNDELSQHLAGQVMGFMIDDTEGAQRQVIDADHQGNPDVEDHMRLSHHQGIVDETRVIAGVFDDQDLIRVQDSMGAKS